jgi:hypothetical protein
MADHYGKFWDRKLARRLDAGFRPARVGGGGGVVRQLDGELLATSSESMILAALLPHRLGHNADIRAATGAPCHRPNAMERAPNRIVSTIMIGKYISTPRNSYNRGETGLPAGEQRGARECGPVGPTPEQQRSPARPWR